MVESWALFLCGTLLLSAFILLWADERRHQHDLLRMERMRMSALYYEMYPMVQYAREHDIDRIRVERDRVTFYGVRPAGRMCEFNLTERDYRPLNKERTRALTLLLAEELPILQSNACYKLRRYKVTRPNGIKDDGYLYTIRSAYKTSLIYARSRVRLD